MCTVYQSACTDELIELASISKHSLTLELGQRLVAESKKIELIKAKSYEIVQVLDEGNLERGELI